MTAPQLAGAQADDAAVRGDAALLDVLAELGPDERRVLLALARRLLAGQTAYGRLDLASDGRHWRKERAEELADALVYGAIGEVAATLGK
ncbi:MAG TPA: hypothetical protein VII82_01310 [Polyangiaceae bacterium]